MTICTRTRPTAEELKRAKDDILNSFIFQFDTPEKVLREKMAYEFYHYPLDFLERYRAEVEKVTADDVTRVARKYVHKEQHGRAGGGQRRRIRQAAQHAGPGAEGGHHDSAAAGKPDAAGAGRRVGLLRTASQSDPEASFERDDVPRIVITSAFCRREESAFVSLRGKQIPRSLKRARDDNSMSAGRPAKRSRPKNPAWGCTGQQEPGRTVSDGEAGRKSDGGGQLILGCARFNDAAPSVARVGFITCPQQAEGFQ